MCPEVKTKTVLTCPKCGVKQEAVMPTDACQYFYTCANCGETLKPKEGKRNKKILLFIIIFAGVFIMALFLKIFLSKTVDDSKNIKSKKLKISATAKTNIDDDPMMGSKNAPVTIIEFSDYECPYCKKFFNETLPQLQSVYIDMGKVRFVYRDLPLSTHEPAATNEARSANCAREQKGDVGYFRFHDWIFRTTKSGGSGLSLEQLIEIGKKIKLNTQEFTECYYSNRYDDEVKADFAAAGKIGAKVTPSFVIGKTKTDGDLEGFFIEGAVSFSLMQAVIDPLLDE